MLRVFQNGIDVSDDAFLFDVIKETGPRGHFLEQPSTLTNFREIWYSEIFDRSLAQKTEPNIFLSRVKSKTIGLIDAPENEKLSADIMQIICEHENKWRRTVI